MELLIFGAFVLVVSLVVIVALVKVSRRPGQLSRHTRKRNQQEVEAWIARTKGQDHVNRMRGDVPPSER